MTRAAEVPHGRNVTKMIPLEMPNGTCQVVYSSKEMRSPVNSKLGPRRTEVDLPRTHALLNRVFDGFMKVGGVGAVHAASQDTYKLLLQGSMFRRRDTLEDTILRFELSHPEPENPWKAMVSLTKWLLLIQALRVGKEAAQWGLVAGVYSGMTYGIQEARGVCDWKNVLAGGAVTGVALSLTEADSSIVRGAITGGAIAVAAEFLGKLHCN